jgi:uncharacterized protein YndB with AHSA1/START domain
MTLPMPVSDYALVTHWNLPAPLPRVWDELMHPERWPQWWRGVRAVELLEPGDAAGIGAYRRMTWRSALPYQLSFNMRTTVIEPMSRIEGVADGELDGRGVWTLAAQGSGTRVRYDWQVAATKPWMRVLAPIAKPLFAWNHGVVMGWGERGLRERLSGPVARTA